MSHKANTFLQCFNILALYDNINFELRNTQEIQLRYQYTFKTQIMSRNIFSARNIMYNLAFVFFKNDDEYVFKVRNSCCV